VITAHSCTHKHVRSYAQHEDINTNKNLVSFKHGKYTNNRSFKALKKILGKKLHTIKYVTPHIIHLEYICLFKVQEALT
jgi:hypothetical protein